MNGFFPLLCNNSQNWLNQIAYACNHRCVWMLFCFCVDQNKVEMCVRQGLRVCHWAGHLQKVTRSVSVAPVLIASPQMWWMEALCIWRTSGSSPTDLHADVILLCVMWSPPWQRITFHRAGHRILDRSVHVSARAPNGLSRLLIL